MIPQETRGCAGNCGPWSESPHLMIRIRQTAWYNASAGVTVQETIHRECYRMASPFVRQTR